MRSWWLAVDLDGTPVRAFDAPPAAWNGDLNLVEVVEDDDVSPGRRWLLMCDPAGCAQRAVSYMDLPCGVRWSQPSAVSAVPVRAR